MRFLGFLAITLWLVAAGTNPTRAAVFGEDNRVPLAPEDAQLNEQVGTLIVGTAGAVCTAFCVAPDMIATASHCLFGTERGANNRLRSIRFKRSSESEGEATPIAGGATRNQAQHVIVGTHRLRVAPPIGADQDWAVARLNRASCEAGGLTLAAHEKGQSKAKANAAHDTAVFNIAVHRDKPDMALRNSGPCTRQENFANLRPGELIRDFSNLTGLIFHDCDTGAGSSGSPLLVKTPKGSTVVGINVGTYVVTRGIVAAGAKDESSPSQAISNTAVATAEFSPAISELAQRELLETKVDVRELQQRLQDLTLYNGPINGYVTAELIAAIQSYERTIKEPETGLASHALLEKLREDGASVPLAPINFTR